MGGGGGGGGGGRTLIEKRMWIHPIDMRIPNETSVC